MTMADNNDVKDDNNDVDDEDNNIRILFVVMLRGYCCKVVFLFVFC